MTCPEGPALMHGYLDGELDPSVSLEFEQHLAGCPACRAALADQQTIRAQMQVSSLYHKAPDKLRQRIRGAVRREHGVTASRYRITSLVAAACAAVLVGLGFLLARVAFPSAEGEWLVREIASAHIRSLQEDHIVDVRSSDTHQVKPWFNGRVDFSPPTRDPKEHGFPLVGGRLDYLDGRPVAALVYRRRDHLINHFVWPEGHGAVKSGWQGTRQGYQFAFWSEGGMNHCVVSDLNSAELNELVRLVGE